MDKRSRKSFERYHAKRVGDLRHMLACCRAGRLPANNIDYLESLLRDQRNLPSPAEIAQWCQLTNAQREANKLYTVTPPIDMTVADLREQRKAKDRQRKLLARRKAHIQSREHYLLSVASARPWEALNMSERTYYRRKKAGTLPNMAEASSEPHKPNVREWQRVVPRVSNTTADAPSAKLPEEPKSNVIKLHFIVNTKRQPLNGYQGIATALSRITDAEPGMV